MNQRSKNTQNVSWWTEDSSLSFSPSGKVRRFFKKTLRGVTTVFLILIWSFAPAIQIFTMPFFGTPVRVGLETQKAEAAYDNGYNYRRSITIDPTKVAGASNFSNFPVLISFSEPDFRTTANGGHFEDVTGTLGQDFIFTTDSDGMTTPLDYETERYNAVTGEVTVWLEVPTLDTTNPTIFYMFYGEPTVTTSQEDITGVWDTDYKGVWHLHETAGSHLDSTLNNNDSSSVIVTTQGSAAGKFSGADDLNGTSNAITIPDSSSLDLTTGGTLEAWIKTDNIDTWETVNKTWHSLATSTLTGTAGGEMSSVDSVIVGETAYYAAATCNNTAETFLTATMPLAGGTFDGWTSRSATNMATSVATGGCSIGLDFNGSELWIVVLSWDNTTSRIAYATSTLDFSSMSAWKSLTNGPTAGGTLESSSVDITLTGDRAYIALHVLTGTTEAAHVGRINLDGSGFVGWTSIGVGGMSGGAGESCSGSVDTDAQALYYTMQCHSTAAEIWGRQVTDLNGTTATTTNWARSTAPNGTGADNYSSNDSTLMGGWMYHSSFNHAAAVTAFSIASSSPFPYTPVSPWLAIKAANGDPDGSATSTGASASGTDLSVESDGKNIYRTAFTYDSAQQASFFISSTTLKAHPIISKLQTYELMQVGTGYAFDWVGKPTTFGSTTAASTFYHVTLTHTGTRLNYYINGVLMGSTTVASSTPKSLVPNSQPFVIGSSTRSVNNGSYVYFDGIVDEVRVSNIARSADWIQTQFNNQNSTSTFYTLGGEVPSGIPKPAGISLASNPKYTIGQASATSPPITVVDGTTPEITTTSDIRIAISTTTGFRMQFDTSITTPTFGGTASGKVNATVSYPSPSELFITVTSNFVTQDTLIISGLKFQTFTAPVKSGTEAITLHTDGSTSGLAAASSTELVTISVGQRVLLSRPPNFLTLDYGLIGHWTFDGKNMVTNVVDSSGQGNTGYIIGQTSTTTSSGKIGQALQFDGSDDYVVSTTNYTDLTTQTYAAWVYRRGVGGGTLGRILHKRNSASGMPSLAVDSRGGEFPLSSLRLEYSSDASNSRFYNLGTSTVPLDVWTHVAVAFNASDFSTPPSFYINGNPSTIEHIETVLGTPVPSADDNTLFIGNRQDFIRAWDGDLDDVRVYNRMLSAEEVTRLYRAGTAKLATSPRSTATGPSAGLVGHWTFDGKNMIGNVADSSGQGNHGVLIHGGSGTTTLVGKLGQGLNFDGSDDYVGVVNQTPFIITGNMTLSTWIRFITTPTTGAGIVSFAISGETEETNGLFRLQVVTTSGIDLQIGHEYGASGSDELSTIDTNLRLNHWYHVTATRDNALKQWKIYVDGVQAGATFTYTNSATGGTTSFLGIGQYTSSSIYLLADMDDVRIYNRRLTSAEVLELYRLGTTLVTR